VQSWKLFFQKFGTHVVTSAKGGGTIEVIIESIDKENSDPVTPEHVSELTNGMAIILEHISNTLVGKEKDLIVPHGLDYKIIFKGGSGAYQMNNITALSDPEDDEGLNIIDQWKDSVQYEPVMLQTYLTLVPITELLKGAKAQLPDSEPLAEAVTNAVQTLFNASLRYIPTTSVSHLPDSRERTDSPPQNAIGDFEALNELVTLFKSMKESSERMHLNYLELLKEQDRETKEQEEKLEKIRQDRMLEEKLREEREREDAKYERQLAVEREQIEYKRQADERIFQAQIQMNRQQIEAERQAAFEKISADQQQSLLNFMMAENERRTQERLNKRDWFDKVTDVVKSAIPALPMLMGAVAG
jgi:hypothetical protein